MMAILLFVTCTHTHLLDTILEDQKLIETLILVDRIVVCNDAFAIQCCLCENGHQVSIGYKVTSSINQPPIPHLWRTI